MDHSWGRGVFDAGLAGIGATLAAPYPLFPETWVTNKLNPNGIQYEQWFVPLNPELPYWFINVLINPAFPHFPYGASVAPDVPL